MITKEFGELRVYFKTESWNLEEHGLIYTDRGFLNELRTMLVEKYNFTPEAVSFVDYSEQGMQGKDYVSLDVNGHLFINEWYRLF